MYGFVQRMGSVMLRYSTVPTAADASMGVNTKWLTGETTTIRRS